MSKNYLTFSNLRSCPLQRSSTMRSPLRCLVTTWGSAPRIRMSSLFILKGDFAATYRLSCELITVNFTNGDQLIKGEDSIRGGQSSVFFLQAEGGAPAPPRHGFFNLLGIGEGPVLIKESIELRLLVQLRGSPPTRDFQLGEHVRGSPALNVLGLPRSYTPNRSCKASIRTDPCPARQTRRD